MRRRTSTRRKPIKQQYPTTVGTAVVTRVTITNDDPPNFEPGNTFQVNVTVEGDAVAQTDEDGSTSFVRQALSGRTVAYVSSDTNICTVNGSGLVTAVATGNCTITAACEGVASAPISVTVSSPLSAVSTVSVSPASVDLFDGQQATLTATPKDASGNALQGKTVTWTRNGTSVSLSSGTTSDPHQITVTAAAIGSTNVTATCDGISSQNIGCTVSAASTAYPNEPAGFTRICEANFSALPGSSSGTLQNQVAGYWWRAGDATVVFGSNTYGSNLSIATDAAAPVSPSSVLRYRYPASMPDGVDPMFFIGWNDPGLGNSGAPAYNELYTSVTLKIEGTDYQNQSTGTKVFYVNYGHTGRLNHSMGFIMGEGSAGTPVVRSAMRVRWSCTSMNADGSDPGYAYNFEQNVNTSPLFTVGSWHRLETYMKCNTIGTANGILKYWLDGTLLASYGNLRYISAQNPLKFHQIRYAPVWGGSAGEVRTRDDYFQVDHLYASGIA